VQSGVVPLRPLTTGELLDAGVVLLRRHARVFLAAGLLLAVVEQAILLPMRLSAATHPPFLLPYDDRLALYWVMAAVGFGAEITIIALLGGLTSRAAGPALLGERLSARQLLAPRGSRFGWVLVIAGVVGLIGLAAAVACGLPWLLVYALVGLIVPALVIDRVGPLRAIGRGLALVTRSGLRAAGVRLVGYVAWSAVRVALGFGSIALLSIAVQNPDSGWVWLAAVVAWAGVNAVAYPALACLDSVLHLETRMRTEGLDIALSRTRATGRLSTAALGVPAR
jgi:hypothetical protein